jgi:hypothetical protein
MLEIIALFHEWGEIERSHRKLAHRGTLPLRGVELSISYSLPVYPGAPPPQIRSIYGLEPSWHRRHRKR